MSGEVRDGGPVREMPSDANAAPAERYASTFHTGDVCHVHRSYIWLMPLNGVIVVAIAILVQMGQTFSELHDMWTEMGMNMSMVPFTILISLGVILVLYGLSVAVCAWAYRYLWFEFDEREFSVYSGIFLKRRVHVPYARVQSVNHKAGVLQRVFGVCTVTVDTAGGSANKAVSIPYVELGVGERIRAELFNRKAAMSAECPVELVYQDPAAVPAVPLTAPVSPAAEDASHVRPRGTNALDEVAADVVDWRGVYGGAQQSMEPVSYEFGLSNSELFLASASHSSALSSMIAFSAAGGLFSMGIVGSIGALFIPLIIAILLVGWLLGMVPIFLSFGGFKVRRRGSRVEVEQGLLQRRFTGIDVDRIQSVVIRQSVVRHFFGYCEVSLGRIDAASQEKSDNQNQLNPHGLIIHPFVRLDKVDELLAGVLPEYEGRPLPTEQQQVAPVALRRGFIRRCIWYNAAFYTALALAALQLLYAAYLVPHMDILFSASRGLIVGDAISRGFLIGYLLCLAITAALAVGTVVWWRGSGVSFNRSFACIQNSGLSTEFVIVPRAKIQAGAMTANPLQRMAHTATVSLVTAAGIGQTKTRLIDVDEACAESWLSWLEPRQGSSSAAQS